MKTIAIIALEGLFDSSFAVTLDILNTARRIHDTYCGGMVKAQILIAGVTKTRLKTGEGLELNVDTKLDQIDRPDFVIVPGLGISDPDAMDALLGRAETRQTIKALKRFYEEGATLTASCSATFIFAEAGLFGHQSATTSWWLSDTFRARYPNINLQTDRMLIARDRLICAGAAMAQADLMMAVINRVYGEETARLTANYLLIDRREFQSQYILSGLLIHRHPEVAKAERWIRHHIADEFSINDLANEVGVSPRTLARRIEKATGYGPLKFVQQLRLEHAVHLLETTNQSFETIAGKVGYMDVSSLRRLLQRQTGKNPSQFRAMVS